MFNVLLDRLPDEWEGYPIDANFRTGIQIMQCLADEEFEESERTEQALSMLFPDVHHRPPAELALKGLEWYLSEYNHDRHKKQTKTKKSFDFDIDQWRIYSAFKAQYNIDLNKANMHWFVFMGLLTNLEDCAFTKVIDIRTKDINPKDNQKVRKAILQAKEVYRIDKKEDTLLSEEEKLKEQAAVEQFNRLRNKNK